MISKEQIQTAKDSRELMTEFPEFVSFEGVKNIRQIKREVRSNVISNINEESENLFLCEGFVKLSFYRKIGVNDFLSIDRDKFNFYFQARISGLIIDLFKEISYETIESDLSGFLRFNIVCVEKELLEPDIPKERKEKYEQIVSNLKGLINGSFKDASITLTLLRDFFNCKKENSKKQNLVNFISTQERIDVSEMIKYISVLDPFGTYIVRDLYFAIYDFSKKIKYTHPLINEFYKQYYPYKQNYNKIKPIYNKIKKEGLLTDRIKTRMSYLNKMFHGEQ